MRTKMERDILVDVRHPFIVHLEYGECLGGHVGAMLCHVMPCECRLWAELSSRQSLSSLAVPSLGVVSGEKACGKQVYRGLLFWIMGRSCCCAYASNGFVGLFMRSCVGLGRVCTISVFVIIPKSDGMGR